MKLKNIMIVLFFGILFVGCSTTAIVPSNTDDSGNLLVNITGQPIEAIDPDNVFPSNIQFLNPINGENMNIDASFSGTPQLIYDEDLGIPTEWDATTIAGTWNFASNAQAYSGTVSIDGSLTSNGALMQLNNGAVNSSIAITGWIYITKWSELKNNHLRLYAYNLTTATTTGLEVDIEGYVNANNLNVWQRFAIPYEDLNVTAMNIDSFRIRVDSDIGEPNAPDFYLDFINLQESGGAVYTAQPFPNSWYYNTHVKVQLCNNLITTEADGTMPKINYSTFLGIPELESGLIIEVFTGGQQIEAFNIKSIGDYLFIAESEITDAISYDGDTMLTMTIHFDKPLVLKYENGDKQEVVLNDNFLDLDCFRATMGGYTVFK